MPSASLTVCCAPQPRATNRTSTSPTRAQQILDYVWSYDSAVLPTQVDVYVSYLRRKLSAKGEVDPIETVRGLGYRLRLAPDHA